MILFRRVDFSCLVKRCKLFSTHQAEKTPRPRTTYLRVSYKHVPPVDSWHSRKIHIQARGTGSACASENGLNITLQEYQSPDSDSIQTCVPRAPSCELLSMHIDTALCHSLPPYTFGSAKILSRHVHDGLSRKETMHGRHRLSLLFSRASLATRTQGLVESTSDDMGRL
ncbi:hypothetical protein DMENIID0001_007770 [Sergentomyia squamirostris]